MDKILIIIPAYNEENNIEKVVDNITLNYPQYDYVVVNDGSTDSTEQVCMQRGYNVINLSINLGIGGAIQTGYLYAYKNNYDVAIQIDGDGQHNIEYVDKLVQPILNNEVDITIGSRFIEKEGFQSSASRRMGITFLSQWIHLLSGSKVKDVTSGFRAVNRKFIEIFKNYYPNDYPEPEAIMIGRMYRGKIREIPVIMNERISGDSSITFKRSIYYMIKVSLAIFISRISYGVRREKK